MVLQNGVGNQHPRPGIEYHTSQMTDHFWNTTCATNSTLHHCAKLSTTLPKKPSTNCYRHFSPPLLSCHGHPSPQPHWNLVSFQFFLYLFSYPQAYFLSNSRPPCSLSSSYPLLQPFAYLPVHSFDLPPNFPPDFSTDYFWPYSLPQNVPSIAQPFHYAYSQLSNRLFSGLLFVSRFLYHLASYSQTYYTGTRSIQVLFNALIVHFETLDDLV